MNQALLTSDRPLQKDSALLCLAPCNNDVIGKPNRIVLLGVVLIVLQILDGILTLTGVDTYGLYAEGNPLLRGLMGNIGAIPAIVITKLMCISLVISLCIQAARAQWIAWALHGIAGLYTVCAIIPWTLILTAEYFG